MKHMDYKIAIIGLGYVGLPLAIEFGKKYKVLGTIGRGGMGFVFKARQPHLDRFVALKLLPDKLAKDALFAERFNREGRVLGRHDGVHHFTVGQRRGLGIALGKPAFVTAIDASQDAVVVGDEAAASSATLVDGAWAEDVAFPLRADVKVRSHHRAQAATIERREEHGKTLYIVTFDEPVRAIAPGQIAVAYRGDRVLGGATITRADADQG